MDCPPPPRDASLRNIIDKLAEFVARNGPEFEMITKQKQQGNPKFEFLYGGEFAAYYQFRVAAEQAFLKQQQGPLLSQAPPTHHQQQQQQIHQQQQQNSHHVQHHAQQQQQQVPTHFTQAPPMHHTQQQQQQLPPPSNVHDANTAFNMNQPPPNHLWNSAAPPSMQQTNGSGGVGGNAANAIAMNLTAQIEAINIQQNTMREQIHQSESNLSAQHSALMSQQKKQIEEAITTAQNAQLEKQAEDNGILLKEFDAILQPIIESCTKDSISSGKNWILQHSSDTAKNNVVLQYLLKKALLNGSTFQQKLHLIYLVNDILHHCVRKNVNDLKNSLENVVIPMFCSADLLASSEQRAKLTKLLSLWESKAKFFDACVISKLQSPDSSMQEYKTNLQNLHHDIVAKFTQATKSTLDNYQKQHQIFIQHATQQITQLEQQKQQLEQQMLASVLPNTSIMPPQQPLPQQQQPNKIPSLMSQKITMPDIGDVNSNSSSNSSHIKPPGVDDNNSYSGGVANNVNNRFHSPLPPSHNHYVAAPDVMQQAPPNFFIPDLSKPPPGFMGNIATLAAQLPSQLQQQFTAQLNNIPQASNVAAIVDNNSNINNNNANTINVDMAALSTALQLVQQLQQQQQQQQQLQQSPQLPKDQDDEELPPPPPHMTEEEQKPSAPYFDLPAGLMVPLIRLEDYRYKALEPTEIRLPPPAPQSERLTNALAAFYAAPTHDHPRDTEGWEKLGLYEYYKVKNAARKQKEEEIENGTREKSRSPTPIISEKPKPKKSNKRVYRSKSRTRSKSRSPYRSRSRSPPVRARERESRSGRSNRYQSRNRSPRRSPQRDRSERERDTSSSSRENRPERSNTRRERERSVTPPSFLGSNFAKPNEFIEETNKGHQMLMKMGWAGTGTGLGTKSQGIDQPISAGEVRDRKDMYKGVGINLNDPFENFRKNKGAAFVHRMRARDEKS